MLRKILFLTAIVSLSAFSSLQAAQIASTWIGGSQGEWGNAKLWSDPCNWDPNIVPDNDGNTFAVTIDANTGTVQLRLQQSRTIDRLDCYGNVWMYMGDPDWIELTINEPNGLTNYGDFRLFIHGSEFDRIVGNITNRGMMELRSIIGYIIGNVTNVSGAELILINLWMTGNISNSADSLIEVEGSVDGNNMENAGSIIVTPAGELVVNNILNNTGEVQIYGGLCESENAIHNNPNGVIKGFGILYTGQLLQNNGQIDAYGGSLTIACEGTLLNTGVLGNSPLATLNIKTDEDVNNQGAIQVHSGGGVVFDCNLVNESNGIIELLGGTLAATTITQTADANLVGFGGITGDIVIEPNGLIELTGPTNIIGDVNIPAGATLEISDGQTLITGHTTCDGTIHLVGGTVVFQGGCDCDGCTITHEAGANRNHFDINADGIEDFKDFASFANTWLWQSSWY